MWLLELFPEQWKVAIITIILMNNFTVVYITKYYLAIALIFRGGWDTEGVTVIANDKENSMITCNSTHLTSFAVLVDVSDGHQVCSQLTS